MTEKAKAYCAQLLADGLEYRAEFVPQSQSRNAAEKAPSLNWRVTIKCGALELSTDYMQGCAHIPHYSHAFARNAAYDAAVREACETGKSRIIAHRNAYDAAQSTFAPGRKIPAPEFADVLYSLLMDASAIDSPDFESWAEDLGYDPDSRRAEKIYRDCIAIAVKLRAMLDLDAAREAFQDY